ncbi:MAG: HD-GYP domain-containing protein [Proteobacteria bacterium]|nr:MAG: HD-GYP domain-containing protein [Pseudomonadota bacterium]
MLQMKIAANQVAKGMYVANLDRPWGETPFPFQGFVVEKESELRGLLTYCSHVFIDVEKGISPSSSDLGKPAPLPANTPPAPLPKPSVIYEKETPIEYELKIAKEVRDAVCGKVIEFMDEIRSGKTPNISSIKQAMSQMEQSILRNPDAFMGLRQLKKKDAYSYMHCIDCSALSVAFGRQLGLPAEQIHDLAMGALLFDIGKTKIPEKLLKKPGKLTEEEFSTVKMHVEFSLGIVDADKSTTPQMRAMIATHHERFNGTGYPKQLRGGQIPLHGRIAAIVDFYDAVTSERPYSPAMSPHDAIKYLYKFRNTHYQDELIEQFIQTIGAYPIGTLVQLSTGEVAIVIEQNQVRRLFPKIIVILDQNQKSLDHPPIRDMMLDANEDPDNLVTIKKSLKPGSYGIDPEDFYL